MGRTCRWCASSTVRPPGTSLRLPRALTCSPDQNLAEIALRLLDQRQPRRARCPGWSVSVVPVRSRAKRAAAVLATYEREVGGLREGFEDAHRLLHTKNLAIDDAHRKLHEQNVEAADLRRQLAEAHHMLHARNLEVAAANEALHTRNLEAGALHGELAEARRLIGQRDDRDRSRATPLRGSTRRARRDGDVAQLAVDTSPCVFWSGSLAAARAHPTSDATWTVSRGERRYHLMLRRPHGFALRRHAVYHERRPSAGRLSVTASLDAALPEC